MTARTRRSLDFGFLCGLVGSLVALLLLIPDLEADGWVLLLFAAPAAGFVSGTALWRMLPERAPRRRLAAGTLAGAIAGVVSHYLTWYLGFLAMNLCYWFTGSCTSSLGEPPANLLQALTGAAAFTFFSLAVIGWLTLPVGAAIGFVFATKTEN
jgi:hypothetical protein